MYFNNHTFINKDTFITRLLRSALLVMALLSTFSYVRAQEVYLEDDDSLSVDSMSMDTLSVRSQTLPWHLAVKEELDHMLQADMFSTSQVGMMVYDLDADSVLYAHGERQLLRPASTMKVLTAIAAIDKLAAAISSRPSFATPARLVTVRSMATSIASEASILASITTTCEPSWRACARWEWTPSEAISMQTSR